MRLIDADLLEKWLYGLLQVRSFDDLLPMEKAIVHIIHDMPTIKVDVLKVNHLLPMEFVRDSEDDSMDKIVKIKMVDDLAEKIIETADITKSFDPHYKAYRYETIVKIVRDNKGIGSVTIYKEDKEDGRS